MSTVRWRRLDQMLVSAILVVLVLAVVDSIVSFVRHQGSGLQGTSSMKPISLKESGMDRRNGTIASVESSRTEVASSPPKLAPLPSPPPNEHPLTAQNPLRVSNQSSSQGTSARWYDQIARMSAAKLRSPIVVNGQTLPVDNQHTFPQASWNRIDNHTCVRTRGDDGQPYLDWQRRAPYFTLIGAMKAGSQAVTEYLWQHPQIEKRPVGDEMHFFDQGRDFRRTENGIDQYQSQVGYVRRFRRAYSESFDAQGNFLDNVYAADSAPYYIFGADHIAPAICCVSPWVKIVAVLREPVARVESHFRYGNAGRRGKHLPDSDWYDWIRTDIRLLRESGVLQDWTKVDFESFSGSAEERMAWKRYSRGLNCQWIVGRGLYAMQIEYFFEAMQKANKPLDDLLIVQSERMRNETQIVFNEMTDFLGLSRFGLNDTAAVHETGKSGMAPLPDDLREELKEIYKPYNQRLYRLLGWNPVWD